MRTFAELLTTFIRQAGITDSELARSIGVSRQTIFRWREGLTERPNKREDVTAIADKLRLNLEERNELLLAGGFRPDDISEPSGEPAERTGETKQEIDLPTKEQDDTPGIDNIKKPSVIKLFFRFSKRLLIGTILVVILIPLIIWLPSLDGTDNNITTNQSTSNQTVASSIPDSINPASSGEILILVSPFCISGDYTGLSEAVTMVIRREGTGNRITNLRVETLAETLDTVKEAEASLKGNNASLVLFGECQSDSVKLQIVPATGQSYPAINIDGNDTVSLNAVSMIILAKACVDSQQYVTAFSLLSKARNSLGDNGISNDSLLSVINTLMDETGIP